MKITKAQLKQIIKEELEAVMEGDLGRTPLGAHFKLDPNVVAGDEVFWYETADGEMLSNVKEVSGEIINISAGPDLTGPVTSTVEGPYVRVKHDAGTVEINPEWFGSVYLRNAPREEKPLRRGPDDPMGRGEDITPEREKASEISRRRDARRARLMPR